MPLNKETRPNLNHKQPINLYYKNQFHNNKIDEHISKNLIQKMFSLLILPKKNNNLSFTTKDLKFPTELFLITLPLPLNF